MRRLELKIPPLLLCAICALLGWAAAALLPPGRLAFPGQHLAGGTLMAVGLAVMLAGALHFRLRRTTLDPRDPAKTSHIVADGIYRRTRNPMYLGMALMLFGLAAWFASPAAGVLAALFCVWIDALQIRPEERILIDRFGEEYRTYMARVRRWL